MECVHTVRVIQPLLEIITQFLHLWMAACVVCQLHKDILENHEYGIVLSVLQIEKTNIGHMTYGGLVGMS